MTLNQVNEFNQPITELKTPLVFFDMDRTILDVGVYHRKNFLFVLNKLYGITELPSAETSGYPYLEVVRIFARAAGIGDSFLDAKQMEMEELLVENMLDILPEDITKFVFPGTVEILEKLNQEKIPVGLTTGSLRSIAIPMLKRSGLLKYFPVTAFGNQVQVREQIIERGLQQAAWVYGLSRDEVQLVTIGDAPADIRAGRAFGAVTISVANGLYTVDELLSYHPDYAFPSLQDTQGIFDKIVLGTICE
jgi:phosphoglycolate phosphatase-like HAD superfamily hydrolase